MSSSQRQTRRRSARLAFDDEEETRPAKRAKTNESAPVAPVKQSTNRKTTTTSKKSKTSYEEEADGFQFSRAKTKKTTRAPVPRASPSKSTATKDELQQPPAAQAPPEPKQLDKPPRTTSSRGKRQQPPEPQAQQEDDLPRRRSGRLSGDKAEVLLRAEPKSKSNSKTTKTKAPLKEAKAPAPAPAPAPVEDARPEAPKSEESNVDEPKGPTKIALPFADTPVIQRNKEMRKNSSTARRSSAGMRGRRASSLMDAGMSNALPHSEVETSEFYKHINQDLMEPRRMKQLLVWCGTRALPEKPSGTAENVNAILAARVIQEELLRDFSNKSDMSDWFNREDIAPASLLKKPNPRNVQNALKLQELELEVKRLQEAKASWDNVLSTSATTISKETTADEAQTSTTSTTINPAFLTEQDAALLHSLTTHSDIVDNAISRFQHSTTGLELHLDSLADGVHKVKKLTEAVDEVADRVQVEASSALERRDRDALERAGTARLGVGDVLRSLARAG